MNAMIRNLLAAFESAFPAAPPTGQGNEPHQCVVTSEPREAALPVFNSVEHKQVGFDLDLSVTRDQLITAVKIIDQFGLALDMITGIDWLEAGQFELVYDFFHFRDWARVALRTRIHRDNPTVSSISEVFAGANWHEREIAEFYGIEFLGHPNLIHLLLPDDFCGYPLRKDFTAQKECHD